MGSVDLILQPEIGVGNDGAGGVMPLRNGGVFPLSTVSVFLASEKGGQWLWRCTAGLLTFCFGRFSVFVYPPAVVVLDD